MWQAPKTIDPVEFFEFLAGVDEYPTNGWRLSQEAKNRGFSDELATFLLGVPGNPESEAELLPHAELIYEAPRGSTLSTVYEQQAHPQAQPQEPKPETLTIEDVVEGGPA